MEDVAHGALLLGCEWLKSAMCIFREMDVNPIAPALTATERPSPDFEAHFVPKRAVFLVAS
jgi:hypothetical protein